MKYGIRLIAGFGLFSLAFLHGMDEKSIKEMRAGIEYLDLQLTWIARDIRDARKLSPAQTRILAGTYYVHRDLSDLQERQRLAQIKMEQFQAELTRAMKSRQNKHH